MSTPKLVLLLLAVTSALQSQATAQRSVLLVHNVQYFELTHGNMLAALKAQFEVVDCFKSSEVLNSRAKLYNFKRPIYDLVVLVLASSPKAMAVIEKLELLKYYDEGNPILLLGSGSSVQSWRILLSQFGFDSVTVDGNSGVGQLYTESFTSRMMIKKDSIAYPKLSEGIANGLVYDGGAISLTPYENVISWSLLEAPENVLFIKDNKPKQLIDRNKMNLIVGAQGVNNKARIVAVGSFKMFSNELNNASEGDNLRYFSNILNWLQFKTQTLQIKNLSICEQASVSSTESKVCPENGTFRNKQRMQVKFQIFDEDGNFYKSLEDKIYVRATKQVTWVNLVPEIIEENGEQYYYVSLGHFETGVYKLTIIHNKPAFHLNWQENTRMINVLPNIIDKIELYSFEGLPFLILISLVMASALNTMRVLLLKKP